MPEYDLVAAAIGELAQSWNGGPLDFAGTASDEDIERAERELGVVFPRSYRAFLRRFGAGTMYCHDIFGLPEDGLWGDVVMMNQLASRALPAHYVRFTDDVGEYSYYLDTSQMNADGECLVVVFGGGEEGNVVAESFLDFLRKAREGLI